MSWHLDNVYDLNKEAPYTFYRPSEQILEQLEVGEVIFFAFENICDTEYDDPYAEDLNHYFDTLVTVSDDVLERIEFNSMLRDHPNEENDSGWSILSGYEDDDFLSQAENFQVISIGVILNIDDSILNFIQKPPLCAYERNEEGTFYEIDNYDWTYYLNG